MYSWSVTSPPVYTHCDSGGYDKAGLKLMNSDGIYPCLTRMEFALFNKAFWDLGFPEPVTTKHFIGSHQAGTLAEPGDVLGLLPHWRVIRWAGPTAAPPAERTAQESTARGLRCLGGLGSSTCPFTGNNKKVRETTGRGTDRHRVPNRCQKLFGAFLGLPSWL